MMNAREWSLLVIEQVFNYGAYANIALDKQHRAVYLEGQERSWAVELTKGTIKAWGTLDWILGFYLSRPIKEIDPMIQNILRQGTFQLFFVPKIPASAACNESVKLAKKYGHSGTAKLVNGVLRTMVRNPEKVKWPDIDEDPARYLSRKHYHPIWLTKRWFEELGFEETEQLLSQNNEASFLGVRVQSLKNSLEKCLEQFEQDDFSVEKSLISPTGLRILSNPGLHKSTSLKNGEATIQDEGAQLIATLLNPQRGETILDACAAPGGKSTHLAELIGDIGEIVAQDIYPHKLRLIENNAKHLQLHSIVTLLGDATKKNQHTKQYDRILTDVPCSGLGTIGRRADTRWRKSDHDLKDLCELQYKILNTSLELLKNGGRLVYSTCTLTKEENEDIVFRFLKENCDISLIPVSEILSDYSGDFLKLWPHITGTDGFFAACFRKNVKL